MDKVTLYAPASFWQSSPTERAEYCNGCGTKGWKGDLVPETIWGVKITIACHIHDWMYQFGLSEKDKRKADMAFLNNMLRLISNNEHWSNNPWFNWFRRYRAMTYYNAVRDFGGPAFWYGKNARENEKTIFN